MPTVLVIDGYRFFFYSNEGHEPPHIHVEKGDALAKYWLQPFSRVWQKGFTPAQLRTISALVQEHREQLIGAWNDYFGS